MFRFNNSISIPVYNAAIKHVMSYGSSNNTSKLASTLVRPQYTPFLQHTFKRNSTFYGFSANYFQADAAPEILSKQAPRQITKNKAYWGHRDTTIPDRISRSIKLNKLDHAGTIGGIGLVLVGHPMDTCKVAIQTQDPRNPKYNGLLDTCGKLYKQGGVSEFYKGVQSPLYGQAFLNAWQFMVWGKAKDLVRDSNGHVSNAGYFTAGGITGALVALIESPVDLVKTQLQTGRYNTFGTCVNDIIKHHGISSLYQGFSATLLRNTIAVSNYFGWYELTKQYLATGTQYEDNTLEVWKLLLSGASGGIFYWLLTYPIDCLKSSMQAEEFGKRKLTNIIKAYKEFVSHGGIKRFGQGFSACMARSIPANAVCFAGYEVSAKFLKKTLKPEYNTAPQQIH